jgi:hypothetical protein
MFALETHQNEDVFEHHQVSKREVAFDALTNLFLETRDERKHHGKHLVNNAASAVTAARAPH